MNYMEAEGGIGLITVALLGAGALITGTGLGLGTAYVVSKVFK